MTLQQLEYLVALDTHRRFAKAAEMCNVTQPTLSTMIQRLEEELGVTLFDRSHQPVIPTAIGKKIIAQAQHILSEARKVTDIIREEKDEISGKIVVGVLPTIAPFLVPRMIPSMGDQFKQVDIEFVELTTSRCLEALSNCSIDMAIIASETQTEGLEDRLLFYEEFLGYVSRNEKIFEQPLVRSSLVDPQRLWLLDEGHCFRDQLIRFCQLKDLNNRRVNYAQGSLQAFMHLVESGQGSTFIPALALSTLSPEQKKLIRPFAKPRPVREIRLAYRADFVRNSLKELISKLVRRVVPEEMLTLSVDQTIAR